MYQENAVDDELIGKTRKNAFRDMLYFCISHKRAFAVCACILIIIALSGALYFSGVQIADRNESAHDSEVLHEFADAEKEYIKTRDSLLASLHESGMQAGEIEKIENSLKQMDDGISRIKNVVLEHPGSAFNGKYLADLYRQETKFLIRIKSNVKDLND